jgi:cell division protein FtsL
MAKRAVGGGVRRRRGRSVVALTLLGFVLVATSVIWRRTFAISQTKEVQRLRRMRGDLEAQRDQLRWEIREASSRERLAPLVGERLRMRMPSDSQVIVIERDTSVTGRNAR